RILVSFETYGDPGDLHSFPTRRSSDLTMCIGEEVNRALDVLRSSPLLPHSLHEAFFAIAEPIAIQLQQVDLSIFNQQRLHGDCQDRKSTRLNSSHVKISYAVFCLKKKK